MNKNVYVIYPGRFQPFHKGHKEVYNNLVNKFGENRVFITTTDDTSDMNRSPFNYDEKKKMMIVSGVSADKILQVKNNYNIEAISERLKIRGFDINSDVILFVVSKKDMDENPRFKKFTKKDGTLSYLQPFSKYKNEVETADKHGYLFISPIHTFLLNGKDIKSASEIRKMYASLKSDEEKDNFIADLYDLRSEARISHLKSIIDPKLSGDHPIDDDDVIDSDSQKELKERLRSYLKREGILSSLADDPKKTLDNLKKDLEKAKEMEKDILGKKDN